MPTRAHDPAATGGFPLAAPRHLAAIALLAVVTAFAYRNAGGAAFVFDAKLLVRDNPVLREASAASVRFLLTHDYWQPMATDGLYRPLTMLTYLADRAVFRRGDRATGYVIENVFLHWTSALLVYALVWRLVASAWSALAAAALFAVHPVATEAVTNVVGRADLLAAVGVLGGTLAWGYGRESAGWHRVPWAVGLLVAAVTAFFGKENGIVLVLAIALWEWIVAEPPRSRRIRAEHLLVVAVLVAYLAARWWVDRNGLPPEDVSPIDNPLVEMDWWTGRLTAVRVLGRLLGLAVWPATLSIDYSYRAIPAVAWPPRAADDWAALAGGAALFALPWLLVRWRTRARALAFLVAFVAAALLPTANLLRPIGSIMAERFLYLPLAGLTGIVAVAVGRIAPAGRRRVVATVVVAIVVIALGLRTARRNVDWQTELGLWAATVAAVPESAKAHKAYAGALFAADPGRGDLARVLHEAERAIALRPDYQQALVDAGSYYVTNGDLLRARGSHDATAWFEQAVSVLERARALDEKSTARFGEKMLARGHAPGEIPDVGDGTLYNNLALAYLRTNRSEDALTALRRLRQLAPLNASYYRDIAAILAALGRWEEAAIALFEAVEIASDQEAAVRLADLYRANRPGVVIIGAEGVQLVGTDPVVRDHRCRAFRELGEIFDQARLHAAAAEAHRAAAAACAGLGGATP